mgnify:CR=1 FL=1
MSNTKPAAATHILASHAGPGWEHGRFGIERKCDCRKSQRGAECASAGWHLVASSDDRGDAIGESIKLAPHGTYRVVDQDDYSVIS